MGAEAACALRDGTTRHEGKALLETDELIFRGSDGFRLKVPLDAIRNARATDDELHFEAPQGKLVLELGNAAEKWAERIRSPKGLVDKLDLKPTHVVALLGVKDATFAAQVEPRVASVVSGRMVKNANVVFLQADSPSALVKLGRVATTMARDGAAWVIHPKGKDSRVKDTDVFASGKQVGLTATKVVRFSETHSAEKLVIPVARR